MESAYFAAGCFWCVQAQFQRVKGVTSVVSGYTGGHVENPTYQQVKTGTTGHYQITHVTFNPQIISFDKLLEIFFIVHDATQTDGQGEDIGSQYLSAIFYVNEQQKEAAIKKIQKIEEEEKKKIATSVLPLTKFYEAEKYHQNYWNEKGAQNPYCSIIPGKIAKLKKYFKEYCTQL